MVAQKFMVGMFCLKFSIIEYCMDFGLICWFHQSDIYSSECIFTDKWDHLNNHVFFLHNGGFSRNAFLSGLPDIYVYFMAFELCFSLNHSILKFLNPSRVNGGLFSFQILWIINLSVIEWKLFYTDFFK